LQRPAELVTIALVRHSVDAHPVRCLRAMAERFLDA